MDLLWRRLAAGLIDIVLALVAAGLIAGAAYAASGGVVRMGVPAPVNSCTTTKTLSVDIILAAVGAAPGHTPTDARICVDRFLGLETNRHLVVAMAGAADARVVFVPLSRSGAVVQPVKLGWLPPLAFILLMALSEGLAGTTPGKFALGLKVDGGLPRALARNLIVHAWLLAWLLTPLALKAPSPFGLAPMLAFAFAVLLALAVRPADPLYDRWTGVRVRRA